MKQLLFLLIILNNFYAKAQVKAPPKPSNLTFSHLIQEEIDKNTGKIIFSRKSSKSYLNSNEIYNIFITKPHLKTDIYDNHINTKVNEVGHFIKDYKNGLWKTTYSEILVKEENWNNGLITGEYKVYNIDKKLLYETNFVKGNGKYKDYYYKTSILKLEGNYENGKKQGEWCNYNEQGKLLKKEYFKEGQLVN